MRLSICWLMPLLVLLPACGTPAGEEKPEPIKATGTVRGKVTYKGKPVSYGVVLFYNHGRTFDPRAGTMSSASFALIKKDGSYEMTSAIEGPVLVCVAADPDVPLMSLTSPTQLDGGLPGQPD